MQPRESGRPNQPSRTGNRHGFTGRASGPQRRERKFSQASLRRPLITYDQHGRPWYCEVSIRSGMPCSTLFPMFVAAWYPDPNYIVVNQDNTSECYIKYPEMRTEKRVAIDAFHGRAVRLATKKSWPIPKRGEPYSEEIIEEIGTAPTAIEPIIAAEQEHPWIMGWSQRPDPRLVELVKRKRRVISVDEEGYDFSEESYNAQLQTPGQRVERKVTPTANAAELERKVAEYVPPTEAEAYDDEPLDPDAEDDDDLDVGTAPDGAERRHAAPDAPLVDVDDPELDGAFQTDAESERLMDLDDELDPEATGGTRVPVARAKPQQPAATSGRRPPQVPRHAPRAGAPAPTRAKPASTTKAGGKGKTIAQGGKPVISD